MLKTCKLCQLEYRERHDCIASLSEKVRELEKLIPQAIREANYKGFLEGQEEMAKQIKRMENNRPTR